MEHPLIPSTCSVAVLYRVLTCMAACMHAICISRPAHAQLQAASNKGTKEEVIGQIDIVMASQTD